MEKNLSPEVALQQLIQVDAEAQERVRQADSQAQALIQQAHEEAEALIQQAREEAQAEADNIRQAAEAETPAPYDKTAETDPEQAYRTDPQALRQRAEPNIHKAADRLVALVTGEDTST
jgi:F-type H+-transporting ATPase subunit b